MDENYTYNYAYLDAPATESSGFKYSSSFQGSGRYLGTSEWFVNEVRSAEIFQKLGVKLEICLCARGLGQRSLLWPSCQSVVRDICYKLGHQCFR